MAVLKLKIINEGRMEWVEKPTLFQNSVQVDRIEVMNEGIPSERLFALHTTFTNSEGILIASDRDGRTDYILSKSIKDGAEVFGGYLPNEVFKKPGTITLNVFAKLRTYVAGEERLNEYALQANSPLTFDVESTGAIDFAMLDATDTEQIRTDMDAFRIEINGAFDTYSDSVDTAISEISAKVDSANTKSDEAISTSNSATAKANEAWDKADAVRSAIEIAQDAKITSLESVNKVDLAISKFATVFNYKGVTWNTLPTNASKGDVYTLRIYGEEVSSRKEYVWTGSEWELLGDDTAIYIASELGNSDTKAISQVKATEEFGKRLTEDKKIAYVRVDGDNRRDGQYKAIVMPENDYDIPYIIKSECTIDEFQNGFMSGFLSLRDNENLTAEVEGARTDISSSSAINDEGWTYGLYKLEYKGRTIRDYAYRTISYDEQGQKSVITRMVRRLRPKILGGNEWTSKIFTQNGITISFPERLIFQANNRPIGGGSGYESYEDIYSKKMKGFIPFVNNNTIIEYISNLDESKNIDIVYHSSEKRIYAIVKSGYAGITDLESFKSSNECGDRLCFILREPYVENLETWELPAIKHNIPKGGTGVFYLNAAREYTMYMKGIPCVQTIEKSRLVGFNNLVYESKDKDGKTVSIITPASSVQIDSEIMLDENLEQIGGKITDLYERQDVFETELFKTQSRAREISDIKLDKTGGVITGNLTIEGDIIQNGAAYETQAEVVRSKNDLIVTRDGAVSGLAEGAYTGIKAEKYDGTNDGMLVFDQGGTARVGDVGELQPLATRDEDSALSDGKYLYWDAAAKKLKAASKADADIVALKTETENIRKDYAAADTSINEAVTSLRTQTTNSFSEANNAIGALRNSVNFFDDEIQSLDSKVDSYGASLNEAVGRVMKNEQAIAGHTSDIATINSRLANIGQGGGSGEGGGTASAGFTLFDGEMELDPANDAQWDCLGVVPSDFPETSGGDATVADVPHDKRTHKLIVLPHADIKSSGYTTLEILFEWRQTVVQPADSYNPETTLEYWIPAVCRMRLNEELFGAMGIGGEAVRSMFGETITDADFAAGIACYQKMSVDNDYRETFYRRTNIIPIAPNIQNPYGETCTFGLSFGTLNGIKSKLKPETFKEFEKIIFGKLNNSVAPPEVCSFLLLNRTFIAPKLQQQPPYYEEERFDSFWNDSFHNGHPDRKKTVHWQPEAITGAPDYETKVHGYKTFMEFGYENRQKCFDIDSEGSWIGATPGVDAEWGLKCLKGLHWDAEFKANYPPFVIKKIRLV